jgi:hypothetical protein
MWHPEGSLWISDSENHSIRRVQSLNAVPPDAAEIYVTLNPGLTVFGKTGATYRIEAAESENAESLLDWTILGTIKLVSDAEMWFDSQPVTRSKRIYRAVKVAE